jgi:uncharacterized repeat protein (TIGR03803 family)
MRHARNRRKIEAAIFLGFACHAAAQTTPPPPPGAIQTLYRFTIRAADGASPVGGLLLNDDGNLYGVTSSGGDKVCQCGTIFRITTSGDLTTIYTFTGGANPSSSTPSNRHGHRRSRRRADGHNYCRRVIRLGVCRHF